MTDAEPPRHEPHLPGGRFVDVPGRGTMFVRDVPGPHPDAPVVLLLHGWTVTADLNWFRCYQPLSEHFRVVAFDHRGHGRGIRSHRRVSMQLLADDAVALADELEIDSFVVVGYSMGGAVAQLLAKRHRHRIDGLVLAATSPTFRGPGTGLLTPGMMHTIAAGSRVMPPTVVRSVYDRMIEKRTDGMHSWAADQVRSNHPRGVLEAGASLFLFDSQEWFGSLELPIGVALTATDERVRPDWQARFAALADHATVHEIHCGHDGCVTAPDEFVPGLLDTIDAVLSPAPADIS